MPRYPVPMEPLPNSPPEVWEKHRKAWEDVHRRAARYAIFNVIIVAAFMFTIIFCGIVYIHNCR